MRETKKVFKIIVAFGLSHSSTEGCYPMDYLFLWRPQYSTTNSTLDRETLRKTTIDMKLPYADYCCDSRQKDCSC